MSSHNGTCGRKKRRTRFPFYYGVKLFPESSRKIPLMSRWRELGQVTKLVLNIWDSIWLGDDIAVMVLSQSGFI